MTTRPDYFSSMELDEQHKSYRAALDLSPGRTVSVVIDWTGISPAEALKRSQDICERIRAREPDYRRKISAELLPLYNDRWRDGEMLDEDGFMHRISLAEIQLSPAEVGSSGC